MGRYKLQYHKGTKNKNIYFCKNNNCGQTMKFDKLVSHDKWHQKINYNTNNYFKNRVSIGSVDRSTDIFNNLSF